MIFGDTFNPQSIFDYIQAGGIIAMLVFILIGGARRWWVFGWQYKELYDKYEKVEQSNATWMQLALRGVNVTEKIVDANTKTTTE